MRALNVLVVLFSFTLIKIAYSQGNDANAMYVKLKILHKYIAKNPAQNGPQMNGPPKNGPQMGGPPKTSPQRIVSKNHHSEIMWVNSETSQFPVYFESINDSR